MSEANHILTTQIVRVSPTLHCSFAETGEKLPPTQTEVTDYANQIRTGKHSILLRLSFFPEECAFKRGKEVTPSGGGFSASYISRRGTDEINMTKEVLQMALTQLEKLNLKEP